MDSKMEGLDLGHIYRVLLSRDGFESLALSISDESAYEIMNDFNDGLFDKYYDEYNNAEIEAFEGDMDRLFEFQNFFYEKVRRFLLDNGKTHEYIDEHVTELSESLLQFYCCPAIVQTLHAELENLSLDEISGLMDSFDDSINVQEYEEPTFIGFDDSSEEELESDSREVFIASILETILLYRKQPIIYNLSLEEENALSLELEQVLSQLKEVLRNDYGFSDDEINIEFDKALETASNQLVTEAIQDLEEEYNRIIDVIKDEGASLKVKYESVSRALEIIDILRNKLKSDEKADNLSEVLYLAQSGQDKDVSGKTL